MFSLFCKFNCNFKIRTIQRAILIGKILGTSYPRITERREIEKGRSQFGFKEHCSWTWKGGRIWINTVWNFNGWYPEKEISSKENTITNATFAKRCARCYSWIYSEQATSEKGNILLETTSYSDFMNEISLIKELFVEMTVFESFSRY